ncbi:MAG: hypothetical protein CBD62_03175 [Candidatus Pelagibacter sp. TMED202]|nr:MAG: hypothetical protein CBD62_03175 [Candidatus Pelagibacter sp. TMED202]|tara:strand:- start:2240 stop:2626 length:387 start_codon:yes stop_codon:yes gene_type:complete
MKTNKIYAESSVGDLIDRITILEIKKLKILNKKDLGYVKKECQILKKILKKNIKIDGRIKKLWKNLKATNNKIWELEDQKRITQKYLEKLSEIAKNVYKLNDERANTKLKINKITKSNIREVKNYAKY